MNYTCIWIDIFKRICWNIDIYHVIFDIDKYDWIVLFAGKKQHSVDTAEAKKVKVHKGPVDKIADLMTLANHCFGFEPLLAT
jgi:hypothetical protein